MIKRIAALTAAVLTGLLCSCGEQSVVESQTEQVTITLSWWGNDARNEYTLKAVKRFEEAHPEIKVKCSYSEWSGYEARSRVQMFSGTEADVMQINVGWLSEYSPDGSGYYDLDQLSDTVDLSNFSDDMLEYGRMGEPESTLNAVPIAMNAQTVYINKTIYDKYGLDVPTHWEDLFEAAKVMSKDGVYPLAAADKPMWLYCVAYGEQVSGKKFFDKEGLMTFTADDFKVMIDFYNRLVKEKVSPKLEDYQNFNIDNGVYAGVVGWVSDAQNFMSKAIDAGNEIVPAPYTAFEGMQNGEGWYEKPATLYAVSKNTEHPKEAGILLDFMLNSHEWAELQGVEKGIPVSKSARQYLDEIGKLSGLQYEASLVMEENEYISPMDSTIENSDLYQHFFEACNLVLFDKETSDKAAKDLYALYIEDYPV